MRAGVSTVQQTLTSEAANVLKLAVAEAQRRGHVQVTPLHVATTLLSGGGGGGGGGGYSSGSAGGFPSILRHACVQSHIHLPNPPQCRALELCFSVALDRLQTTASAAASAASSNNSSTSPGTGTPSLSNALVAALKRAQAHQRRGYPEQQQVPLLAVKVEMEQLVISILDDPSVSRVMREAKFSSTQVKSSLEEAMAAAAAAAGPRLIGGGLLLPASASGAAANVDRLKLKLGSCLEPPPPAAAPPQLRQQFLQNAGNNPSSRILQALPRRTHAHDISRLVEILVRGKRRNPLLIGEQHPPHGVVEEFFNRIEQQQQQQQNSNSSPPDHQIFLHGELREAKIFSPQFASIALGLHGKDEVEQKLRELAAAVERCSAAIIFLGDLQWLVERSPPSPPSAYCPVQHAIGEISRMVAAPPARLWLVGVSSSQTYIRCQSRHPSLESVWGLQPLPIATSHFHNVSLRNNTINSARISSLESGRPSTNPHVEYPSPPQLRPWPALVPLKLSSVSHSAVDLDHGLENCCPECTTKYEHEVGLIQEQTKDESKNKTEGLPFWLKPKDSGTNQIERLQKTKELQRKWAQTCHNLHHASSVRSGGMNGKVVTSPATLPTTTSIPWLSLQPTTTGTNFPVEKDLRSGPADDALSLSLKPSCREPEVATELMLGRSNGDDNTSSKPKPYFQTGGVPTLNNGTLLNLQQQQQQNQPSLRNFSTLPNLPTLPSFNIIHHQQDVKFVKELDFKALCKSLIENVPWQREALDKIASTVLHCRSGLEKRRNGSTKSDTWLLLLGSDTMGKKKVARVLAEQVFGSEKLFTRVSLKSQTEGSFARGRTSLDRVVEAIRMKPFSVVLLDCIEQADSRLRNALVKAMESGRLADSSGREASVANSIFVMTSTVGEEFLLRPKLGDTGKPSPFQNLGLSEKSLSSAEMVGMKLVLFPCLESCSSSSSAAGRQDSVVLHQSERVSVVDSKVVIEGEIDEEEASSSNGNHGNQDVGKTKRKAVDEDAADSPKVDKKCRTQVSLDLNMPVEDENGGEIDNKALFARDEDGSASEQLVEKALDSLSREFCSRLNGTVVFRPFDFDKVAELVLLEINRSLAGATSSVLVEVESSVFRHLVAVLWEGQGRKEEFEDWVMQVLGNTILELVKKGAQEGAIVRLAAQKLESSDEEAVLHLPRKIASEVYQG